jgi:glycosyltransferase involved in cell wall biosynthesis
MEQNSDIASQPAAAAETEKHDFIVAFVGIVVPDESGFVNEAFSRAGNMSQLNLLKSLVAAEVRVSLVLSFLPIPSYPRTKRLWVSKQTVRLFGNCHAVLLPFINLQPIKQIHWGISVFLRLLFWGLANWRTPKVVYLYNLSRPPAVFQYIAARLVRAKIVASLYDITIPGVVDPDDVYQRMIFHMTKWIIPRLDGRIVITEQIVTDFAPGKSFLLVDGGVTKEALSIFEPVGKPVERPEFVLAFAGSLWEGNGIPVILKAFAQLKDPACRLWIAGKGELQDEVLKASANDPRISYKGLLDHQGVLAMYEAADVLLNIRITKQVEVPYAFPSKFIEYLATGKCVVTTSFAHVESEYGQYCFVMKSETPEALAEVIENVRKMGSEERQRFGAEAREYVARNKTWERQGLRIAKYLEGIMETRVESQR